ncbi:RNA-binding S4 domain-containing protein [Acidimangrovimonas sediminis]|uniref:RNA-binding S4 domain-containing protein n=1 Tax=Acidimangrovimonas sediminis TaxID=2056283 RepID=UPI001E553E3A|nr:RNA-binding S4 domain-containing protein [Acidimangrovimonas sediminis]
MSGTAPDTQISGSAPRATLRLDKWLWQARFFKTRSLAAKVVSDGAVRVNARRVTKPAQAVGAGDTLTFAAHDRVRVVRILAVGIRRGPAPEAQALYEDLSPAPAERDRGAPVAEGPRPTKKDRRILDQTRRDLLE